ncbi:hypothetical protein PAXRUDRAFT_28905 [Paxillus rubicundulus Ve08.2h10]|uniref:Uncharacterized protein n=1 Tax=Paxillus rubicundulus Ve08.2h10 TaxID=930991 RepID=A0A0D0CZZ2_9AGAM|nr:hypothetical protein PAXRUDRAFT_28905 [Paxillus rubicundulus Ve08.2h10]
MSQKPLANNQSAGKAATDTVNQNPTSTGPTGPAGIIVDPGGMQSKGGWRKGVQEDLPKVSAPHPNSPAPHTYEMKPPDKVNRPQDAQKQKCSQTWRAHQIWHPEMLGKCPRHSPIEC